MSQLRKMYLVLLAACLATLGLLAGATVLDVRRGAEFPPWLPWAMGATVVIAYAALAARFYRANHPKRKT